MNLARTLIINPRILLLDEPFGALDPYTRAHLQDWLLDVKANRDLTVVLVTHDVDEALKLADRIIIMSAGPGTLVKSWDLKSLNEQSDSYYENIKREILENYQVSVSPSSDYATETLKTVQIEPAQI